MKRYLWLTVMLFGLLALAACGARATPAPVSEAPPTSVPATNTPLAPTATVPAPTEPAPTVTAEPTAAPTLEPTVAPTSEPAVTPATPVPATPDPDQGVGAVTFEDRLNGLDGWGWNFSDDAVSFAQADDELQAVMTDPNAWWRFTLGPDGLALGDQQVKVTAHTVACGAQDEYALMFRAAPLAGAPEGQYQAYVFKLNCAGAARLDRLEGTRQTALVEWTASDAIRAGAPATNELLVWMAGPEFRFYVNGEYLFSAQDAGLANGTFGFYVDDQTAGGLTVNFEDLSSRTVAAVSGN